MNNSFPANMLISKPKKLNFVQLASLVFLWGAILSVSPFVIDHAMFGGMFKPLFVMSFVLSGLFLFLTKNIFFPKLLFLPLIQAVVFLAYFVVKGDVYYSAFVIRLLVISATLVIVHNAIGWHLFVKSFINIMMLFSILGIGGFVFGLFGFKPISIFENPDTRLAYNYILTFSNSIINIGNIVVIRIASYFDEPGTFGFFLIFAIMCNRMFGFSMKKELILIVGGIFTFSLAFYILVMLYIVLFGITGKNYKISLSVLFILTLFFTLIYCKQDDSPGWQTAHRLTLGRLNTVGDERIVAGDNRSQLFKKAYGLWQKNFFWGGSPSELYENHGFYGANIISTFANHGIFGGILYLLPIIYASFLALLNKNISHFFVVVILWTQYLQRPNISGLFEYLCILFIICLFHTQHSQDLEI